MNLLQDTKHTIIIITNGNYFARLILDDLIKSRVYNILGVLIIDGDYKARTGLKSVIQIGKATAFPYFIYKIISIAFFKLMQFLFNKSIYSVERFCINYSIPFHHENDVNSKRAIGWVLEKDSELLVSVSCPQKIQIEMLSSVKIGGINIHSSLLPKYAGLAPYFWVLSKGEDVTGTTVHRMTQKFDEGNIFIQKEIKILSKESCHSLFTRLSQLGSEALIEAVGLTFTGKTGIKQNLESYSYYSNPTFKAYMELKKNGHCLVKFPEFIDMFIGEIKNIY